MNVDRAVLFPLFLLIFLAGACSSGDETDPAGNQAPAFRVLPVAAAPAADLLRVVPGDVLAFEAAGLDPDVEEVFYSWDIVGDESGEAIADVGTLVGASTATPTWTVGRPAVRVRVQCTISDAAGASLTRSAGVFRPGTPIDDLVVNADTTLTADSSPYVVRGDLRVSFGARLTLEPGVELQFRPDRASGAQWEKRSLIVEGELISAGELEQPVIFRGGYGSHPGTGQQQYRGIRTGDTGRIELRYSRVEFADLGLRLQAPSVSTIQYCAFEDCGTGVLVARGTQTSVRDAAFRDNSVGLQLNNAGATVERCAFEFNSLYGIDVDSSTDFAQLTLVSSEFNTNLQAHLRLNAGFPNPVSAMVRGTNFFRRAGQRRQSRSPRSASSTRSTSGGTTGARSRDRPKSRPSSTAGRPATRNS